MIRKCDEIMVIMRRNYDINDNEEWNIKDTMIVNDDNDEWKQ